MTSLLALFSILGTALAGSGGEDDTAQQALPSEDETAPEEPVAETVTTTESYVPEWVSVIDALATVPVEDTMPANVVEDDDGDAFFM